MHARLPRLRRAQRGPPSSSSSLTPRHAATTAAACLRVAGARASFKLRGTLRGSPAPAPATAPLGLSASRPYVAEAPRRKPAKRKGPLRRASRYVTLTYGRPPPAPAPAPFLDVRAHAAGGGASLPHTLARAVPAKGARRRRKRASLVRGLLIGAVPVPCGEAGRATAGARAAQVHVQTRTRRPLARVPRLYVLANLVDAAAPARGGDTLLATHVSVHTAHGRSGAGNGRSHRHRRRRPSPVAVAACARLTVASASPSTPNALPCSPPAQRARRTALGPPRARAPPPAASGSGSILDRNSAATTAGARARSPPAHRRRRRGREMTTTATMMNKGKDVGVEQGARGRVPAPLYPRSSVNVRHASSAAAGVSLSRARGHRAVRTPEAPVLAPAPVRRRLRLCVACVDPLLPPLPLAPSSGARHRPFP